MTSAQVSHARCGEPGCVFTEAMSVVGRRLWKCIDCGGFVCDGCWDSITAHSPGRTARDRLPHERIDPRIERALHNVLRPKMTERELEDLHERDEATTWFGMQNVEMSINIKI
jgi:hypothetical protein